MSAKLGTPPPFPDLWLLRTGHKKSRFFFASFLAGSRGYLLCNKKFVCTPSVTNFLRFISFLFFSTFSKLTNMEAMKSGLPPFSQVCERTLEQQPAPVKPLRTLDIFSGAGGLSKGFNICIYWKTGNVHLVWITFFGYIWFGILRLYLVWITSVALALDYFDCIWFGLLRLYLGWIAGDILVGLLEILGLETIVWLQGWRKAERPSVSGR